MKIHERCVCGAEFSIEVDMTHRNGTPTWDALLANLKTWRESHQHLDLTRLTS